MLHSTNPSARLILLAVCLGCSCPLPSRAADDIVVEQDIVYGKGGDVDLQLDLARPQDGNGPFPAIVFIHGGGWVGGDRQSFRSKIEDAARRGYVAVTITYRLAQPDPDTELGKVPFPAQIQDCKCAVRWIRFVAEKYRIDPDRIGVAGASAGGHLSLLVGLAEETAGLEGAGGHAEHSSRVRAVVNLFGPTDLTRAYEDVPEARRFAKALCRGTPDDVPETYKAASPVTYVSKDDPPVLTLVLPSQAKLLHETMKEVGARHELVILEGQGHGFSGDAAKRAEDALWTFFERELKSK
jgi:acetyl esterase/lipase